jgi:hypothetical protein
MILSTKQKGFIKANRTILEEIFTAKIEDLRDKAEVCPPEMTESIKMSIKDFREWLGLIKVFTKKKKKEKEESFI